MKVNLSIDDITPRADSGLEVLDKCEYVLERFPDVKFTLFVPVAYFRTDQQLPLYISMFPEFCDRLRKLNPDHYEIGYHGWHHGIPGKSNNDEFKNLSYDDAYTKMSACKHVFDECKIDIKPIFRPPAFKIRYDAARALFDFGIQHLSLYRDFDYGGRQDYEQIIKHYDDRVSIVNCNPPFHSLRQYSQMSIMYHACQWDRNYLSYAMADELCEFLTKHSDVNFCFLEEL